MSKNLVDYKKDEKVLGFFLVKSCELRTSNKGGEYMDLVISDNSGEISAKVWDLMREETAQAKDLKSRDVIKVQGVITEWNSAKQLKVIKIRKAKEEDEVDLSSLVKTAPLDGEELYRRVYELLQEVEDEEFKSLTESMMEKNKERLLYFPAASKNHHAVKAGLLYHVYRMLLTAKAVCGIYPLLSKDILYSGVILHDIAKLEEIDSDELGIAESYTFEGQMLGHIVQGIKMIDAQCRELGISDEKRIMLEHMILSHHYEPEYGSPKKPMFPEAEMLHYLDLVDARMYDMEKALEGVEEGEFSERIWSMDNRKIYKPKFGE